MKIHLSSAANVLILASGSSRESVMVFPAENGKEIVPLWTSEIPPEINVPDNENTTRSVLELILEFLVDKRAVYFLINPKKHEFDRLRDSCAVETFDSERILNLCDVQSVWPLIHDHMKLRQRWKSEHLIDELLVKNADIHPLDFVSQLPHWMIEMEARECIDLDGTSASADEFDIGFREANQLFRPPAECDVCGESVWVYISTSPNRKSAKWRCEYCNRRLIVRADSLRAEDSFGRERISRDIQREVWRRDQGCCVVCGSKASLEFDHIIPVSRGGSNTVRNIQILCETCNRKKSNKV